MYVFGTRVGRQSLFLLGALSVVHPFLLLAPEADLLHWTAVSCGGNGASRSKPSFFILEIRDSQAIDI